jgi:phosphate:Na+ symporter
MNWDEIKIWYLLAGLGLFLFGISLLEDAIKTLSGRTVKTFLQKHTGHPVKAVVAGALVTGIMQSSSMVTLLVMSFTGAGVIGLKNGIGMLLGANLGTTITGWIVALLGFKLNPENFYLTLISAGSLILVFSNNGKIQQFARIIFGFGLMFMGLEYMKQGFLKFTQTLDLNILVGQPAVLFIIFGFFLAASIRSSAAAMVIFLTSLSAGSIDLLQAGYLAIGADIGTTVTGLLGTLNANAIRRKTGWAQFYINIITAVFTILLINPIFHLIRWSEITDPLIALVTFHSLFNFMGILLILPFIGKFTYLINRYISTDKKSLTKFLPFNNSKDILTSTDALDGETISFLQEAINIQNQFIIDTAGAYSPSIYFNLKAYENEIFNLSTPILQNKLSADESKQIQAFYSTIRYAALAVKDIKDVQHNIIECSQSENDEIYSVYLHVLDVQKDFYGDYLNLINTYSSQEQIMIIRVSNEQNYENQKNRSFELYRKNQNFDLASILNMLREIRDSRELFLKAYEQYLGSKQIAIKS